MGPDASLTPELIQAQSFTNGFRGYDTAEVRAFLTRVANELRAWRERAEGLESAWHSAEERAARPPVLDEDTLMAAVGEETAAILRTARAAAADMRTKATEESERALSQARSEAERILAEARDEAQRTVTEAEGEVIRLRSEAETAATAAAEAARLEAAGLLDEARRAATEILQRAATEAEDIRAQVEKDRQLTIDGANTTRDRILEDLGRRRRVATVQIEQLRAGRERLIESYAIVRRTLEEVQSELSRADAEARAAADDVGRRLKDDPHVELTEASRALTEPLAPPAEPAAPEPAAPEPGGTDTAGTEAAAPDAAGTEATGTDTAGTETTGTDTAGPDAAGTEAGGVHDAAHADADAAAGTAAVDGEPADAPVAEADPADVEPGGAGTAVPGTGEPDGGAQAGESPPGSAVDELFARIRATRPSGEDAGDGAPDHPPADEPATGEAEPAAETTPEIAATVPGSTAVDAANPANGPAGAEGPASDPAGTGGGRKASRRRRGAEPPATAGHPPSRERPGSAPRSTVRLIEPPMVEPAQEEPPVAAGTAAGGDPATGAAGQEPVPDGDEALLQARELSVVQLELNLTRRLKRALQDEQNDVLDRLRNLKEAPDPAGLLPGQAAQVARYSSAAVALLGEAASAGAVFADETLALPGRDAPVEVDVADLADECGSGIVAPLRRRLEQAIEMGAGEDQAVLVESIGAAYREWKTQKIERLAGDVLSAAFSRGTWEAAPSGTALRWVVDDVDGPCPDCDDDALAGEIPKGEEFPTGQHHPPAHSGCRCLLVPSMPAS